MAGLSIKNLEVHYPTETGLVRAVDDVTLNIGPGVRMGFVGESGSGKTTTALAVMRMLKEPGFIAGGSIVLDDLDITALSQDEVRKHRLTRLSYVPQGAMNSLNPVATIGQQIIDGMIDHGVKKSRRALMDDAKSLLVGVGLSEEVARKYPHELSGGMKQRACIAIATALKPSLLIADEPTSALDVVTQRQVMDTLGRAQKQIGSSLMLIGHDMGLMAQFVDELAVMKDGKIVEIGKTRDLFSNPQHAYTKMLISSIPSIEAERSPVVARNGAANKASNDNGTPLIEFVNVAKVYGQVLFGRGGATALDSVSMKLDAAKPSIVSIVGQSGSGKTTMGNLLLGLTHASAGTIKFDGKDVANLRGQEARNFRSDVQAIFQDPYSAFNPFYKVDHALSVPLVKFGIARDRDDIYARMETACRSVGLDPGLLLGRFPHELSGGQRQRLQVARALMLKPRLIVADEPVSMIDASMRATVLDSLADLKRDHGISIFYITHDLATAYVVSDYVIVLNKGRVAEAGTVEEVIAAPQHPYTQLLINSIPWPDPDRTWGGPNASENPAAELAALDDNKTSIIRSRIPGFHLDVEAAA